MKGWKTLLWFCVALAASAAVFAAPTPAQVSAGVPQTGNISGTPGNVTAAGGNITQVNVSGRSITNAWQGFFGEVFGNITLEDASGDVMFTWNFTNLTGEVYASRNSSIDFTSVGAVTDCTVDETLTGTGNDRVNSTFSNATVSFTIGTTSITAACRAFTYVSSAPQSASFEEIIVNATGVPSIYVSNIDADTTGFDGVTHDYQMIVPDTTAASTSTYFFFLEFN